jgi:hypothetical protein
MLFLDEYVIAAVAVTVVEAYLVVRYRQLHGLWHLFLHGFLGAGGKKWTTTASTD